MRRITSFFLFGIVLFTPLFSAFAGGISVGNGGFGVWRGQAVELFDLVEAGIKPRRTVVHEMRLYHPRIEKIADRLGIEKYLLATKLTELDWLIPGFGVLVAEVIAFYDWKLQPRIEGLTKDACPGCVQVAVRSAHTIDVNGEAWRAMNQDHRIALLLHETAFAMMRTDHCPLRGKALACDDMNFREIRALVASFFAEPFKNRDTLVKAIRTHLKVDHSSLTCVNPYYSVTYKSSRTVNTTFSSITAPDIEYLAEIAAEVCDSFGVDEPVRLELMRTVLILRSTPLYETIYGPQYFLEVLGRFPRKKAAFFPTSREKCRSQLVTTMNAWFNTEEDDELSGYGPGNSLGLVKP